jgi:hypothetical protein
MQAATPAWAGRAFWVDPDALPARYQVPLESGPATGPDASVYLDDRGVIVKRRLAGLPLTLSLPLSAYEGIAVRLTVADGGGLCASLELSHRDPYLSLPLAAGRTMEDTARMWRRWCDVSGLPMLIVEADGRTSKVHAGSAVPIGSPQPRRRTGLLTRRRPRFLVRRKPGRSGEMPVLTGWRAIIART